MTGTGKLTAHAVLYSATVAVLASIAFPAFGTIRLTAPVPGIHSQTKPPTFPYHVDAKAQIHKALLTAAMQHRRVLVNFGSNSCQNCLLLSTYLHNSRNFYLIKHNYVLVNINVGSNFDQNADIARDYSITLTKGVPALVVLDKPGHVVSAPQSGKFTNLRKQGSASVTAFLEKWKPPPASAP